VTAAGSATAPPLLDRTAAAPDLGRRLAPPRRAPFVVLVPPVLVVMGMLIGSLKYGAFYLDGQIALGLPIALAVSITLRRPSGRSVGMLGWTAIFAAALGMWAVMRGSMAGTAPTGAGVAAMLVAMAAAVVVCRRTVAAGRELLRDGLVAVGALVAVTGWIGAATHTEPWGMMGENSWRASSTITYPNAAAALMAVAALTVLAERVARPRSAWFAMVTTVLLAGLLATQSRGGLLALAVGGVVLVAALGLRPVLRATVVPALGAVVAQAGLVPAMAQQATPRPGLAAIALLAGLGAVAATTQFAPRSPRVRRALLVAVLAVTGVALWGAATRVSWPADRMTVAAAPRVGAAHGAVDLFLDHPLVGVGPARTLVVWQAGEDEFETPLIHDEYLQTATALGLVGVVLLGGMLAAAAVALLRARPDVARWRWAGSTAALAALAVHSAVDFLWHLAVIPICAAVLIGLATTGDDGGQPVSPEGNPT